MYYIKTDYIIIDNGKIYIDGDELPTCPTIYSAKAKNIRIIDKKVYLNGYEYKKGKWKKTLKAILYKYF